MPHDPYKALYIHIPYCAKKCAYCDFTSFAVKRDSKEIDNYVENLIRSIRQKAKDGELDAIETVYVGGGTPSYIGNARLTSLLYALSTCLSLSGKEVTMEANPESVDEALIKDLWALGVNRLSFGVQSFDDAVLTTLGRAHNAARALEAVEMAQMRFQNISIDLMCGIPGQSVESFQQTLEVAASLPLTHLSVYPLSIEPHTLFEKMIRRGKLPEPDADVQAEQMKQAARFLSSQGFNRYEVASYAKPGFECKHNIAYWTGVPYLGIGTSAATMTQNAEHRMRVTDGVVQDSLNAAEMLAEDLMMGMRMTKGLSFDRVAKAQELLPKLDGVLDSLIQKGLVEITQDGYSPTELGWLCGNELYGALFELA